MQGGTMEDVRLPAAVPLLGVRCQINGYGSMVDVNSDVSPATITEDYADAQSAGNAQKTLDFILPLVQREDARTLLDIGCGTGVMVKTLIDRGLDAYGAHLRALEPYWARQNLPRDRLFIVDATDAQLPFQDETIDF